MWGFDNQCFVRAKANKSGTAASGAKRSFARKQHQIQTIAVSWTHDP
jgi:hypothetical protein